MPKVSIIIPSYNHSSFLIDRLESIAAQTYKDWEAIIIDDKSLDDSVQIIENFLKENPNFKVKYFIVNNTNSGSGYKSWQKGIELATTDYIWIAETDDCSDPIFLEKNVYLLENNKQAVLVFTTSVLIDDKNNHLYTTKKRTYSLNVLPNNYKVLSSSIFLEKLPLNPFIVNGSSVVFKKQESLPPFIFQTKLLSDQYLWSYLVSGKSFIFNNVPLNFFRQHNTSTSQNIQNNHSVFFYKELIDYCNHFKCNNSIAKKIIIKYIKEYIIGKKRNPFKFRILMAFENIPFIKILYFYFSNLSGIYVSRFSKKAWIKFQSSFLLIIGQTILFVL